jgi:hypothetical protein
VNRINNTRKYCAFTADSCVRSLPEQNDLKLFFAYPSENKIKGYIRDICKHKKLVTLELSTWENINDVGGIIFCKICKQILESRSIVADVTYINQNVLFELGFALANGKIPILIKEQGRNTNVVDILRDIKRIDYNDIDVLVDRLYHACFEDFPFSNLDEDEKSKEDTVFFINANANMPVKRPIYKCLEEFCRDCFYDIHIDDASEIISHKLIHLLKMINASELVICHMVGTDYNGYDEINAHVAFLAGYAMGKHKKVLILQEQPSDKMLDLQQVRREYKNRKDAVQILDKWLAPIKKERLELLSEERKSNEYDAIHESLSFTLGKPAAEYDSALDDCFIMTDDYTAAKQLKCHLFIGRRGSGKTANCLQLSKDFKKNSNNIVVDILPSKLQLASAIDTLYTRVGQTGATALFEMFWQYLILTEIAIQCQRFESSNNIFMSDPKPFYDVRKLLQDHIYTDTEFDGRFNELINRFCDLALQAKSDNIRAEVLRNFYKDYFPKMQIAIKNISDLHPIMILIDNLDKDWDSQNMISVSAMINSLFDVMDKININHLFGNCNVIAFLRADIYSISSKYDSDFDKRQPRILAWDPDSLKALVCERIASAKGLVETDNEKLWVSIFDNNIEPFGDSFNFIVSRTMLRPRDILTFCTIILDNLNNDNVTAINSKIIDKSEIAYSQYLLLSIRQEYLIGYPNIQDVCADVFLEKNATIAESELRNRIKNYVLKNTAYSIDSLIRFCFKSGLLGILIEEVVHYSYEGRDYDFLIKRASQSSKGVNFFVHPGLHKFLEIKE